MLYEIEDGYLDEPPKLRRVCSFPGVEFINNLQDAKDAWEQAFIYWSDDIRGNIQQLKAHDVEQEE